MSASELERAGFLEKMRVDGGRRRLRGGCAVELELEALDIVDALATPPKRERAFRTWLDAFFEEHGRRPTASEAAASGFGASQRPKALRRWFPALRQLGALSDEEDAVVASPDGARLLEAVQAFAEARDVDPGELTVVWSALRCGRPEVSLQELVASCQRVLRRDDGLNIAMSHPDVDRALVGRWRDDAASRLSMVWVPNGDGASWSTTSPTAVAMAGELVEVAWNRTRRELRRAQVRKIEVDGEPLNASFTLERSEEEWQIYLESRSGAGGRNAQYGDGLRVLLERAKAWRGTLERVELATRQASGVVEPRGYRWPLSLAEVDDLGALRRAIQGAQGNNPTRRIRLVVSGGRFSGASLGSALHWLEFGKPLRTAPSTAG